MIGRAWTRLRAEVQAMAQSGELGVAVVILCAVLFAVLFFRREPDVPPEILSPRVDSAQVAEQVRRHIIDSVSAAAARDAAREQAYAATLQRRAAALEATAATQARRADALAAAARAAGDTASLAWSAYEAERERGDSLEVAGAVKDTIIAATERRAAIWQTAHDSVDAQRRAVLALNLDLREAVDRAVRRQPRQWSLGVGAGMGCTVSLSGTDGTCGPTVAVTVQKRIF